MRNSADMMSLPLAFSVTCTLKSLTPSRQPTSLTAISRVSPSIGSERYFIWLRSTRSCAGLPCTPLTLMSHGNGSAMHVLASSYICRGPEPRSVASSDMHAGHHICRGEGILVRTLIGVSQQETLNRCMLGGNGAPLGVLSEGLADEADDIGNDRRCRQCRNVREVARSLQPS